MTTLPCLPSLMHTPQCYSYLTHSMEDFVQLSPPHVIQKGFIEEVTFGEGSDIKTGSHNPPIGMLMLGPTWFLQGPKGLPFKRNVFSLKTIIRHAKEQPPTTTTKKKRRLWTLSLNAAESSVCSDHKTHLNRKLPPNLSQKTPGIAPQAVCIPKLHFEQENNLPLVTNP